MYKTITVLISLMCFLPGIVYSTSACIVLNATQDDYTIAASNMDWNNTHSRVWFRPADQHRYACACVGFEDLFPQGGVNEHGLFYDCTLCPSLEVVNSTDKPRFFGFLAEYCLRHCTTVEEIIDVYDNYNLEGMETYQIMFADATGDSVIIEGDEMLRKHDSYQIMTNFYHSHPEIGWYPCWRYTLATQMMEACDQLSMSFMSTLLDATNQGGTYATQYSWVCNLSTGCIYLYHYHNFDNVAIFNISEEVVKGFYWYSIASLFNGSHPPATPQVLSAPKFGRCGTDLSCTAEATDPNDDQIYYLFDWGDGFDSGWLGPFGSGVAATASHQWQQAGFYEVKVRVKDTYGQMSDWTNPQLVCMPKQRSSMVDESNDSIDSILEAFPVINLILRIFQSEGAI